MNTSQASPPSPINIFEMESRAKAKLTEAAWAYLSGGCDGEHTLTANCDSYRNIQIRCRRLVDVSSIDLTTELFGMKLAHPIVLAPVGFQQMFHPNGECATARAAANSQTLMIASSLGNCSIGEVAKSMGATRSGGGGLWFQLYPTPDRNITKQMLKRAENAGTTAVALTVDTPVVGHREKHPDFLDRMIATTDVRLGNYEGLRHNKEPFFDPSMTWEMIKWLRDHTSMKIVLKGIVTHEDAALCITHGVDGIIVSNHGGRQEESCCATIESLPEVVDAINGKIPVLIDGGIRRGTDIFKALALGATAVCIGRPYIWGLAAHGQPGVELVIDTLKTELTRAIQLAGTTSLSAITRDHVRFRSEP